MKKSEISAIIPAAVLSRIDLPMYVKLVYGRVVVLISRTGKAVVTTQQLAESCGISNRQAAKSLRYLVSLGLIRFHRSLENHSTIHVFQLKKNDTEE